MKVLLQRVTQARVEVASELVGSIDRGLLLLVGLEKNDTDAMLPKMAEKLLNYRVFPDEEGRMNLSVKAIGGGILAVSQFTLAADCSKGNRPGFSTAMAPEQAEPMFNALVEIFRQAAPQLHIATGRFGASMQVHLCNDGPVTFMLSL